VTIAIVLGNRLNDDGSFSPQMTERMNLTLDLIKKFHIDLIVTSGGVANKVANIAEADAMRDYLVKCGVKESMIICENKSISTYENAKFSMELIKDLNYDTIFNIIASIIIIGVIWFASNFCFTTTFSNFFARLP